MLTVVTSLKEYYMQQQTIFSSNDYAACTVCNSRADFL